MPSFYHKSSKVNSIFTFSKVFIINKGVSNWLVSTWNLHNQYISPLFKTAIVQTTWCLTGTQNPWHVTAVSCRPSSWWVPWKRCDVTRTTTTVNKKTQTVSIWIYVFLCWIYHSLRETKVLHVFVTVNMAVAL